VVIAICFFFPTCSLSKQDPQGFGSALTYLRRYSLSAICGLYADDDDGNRASSNAEVASLDVAAIVKGVTNATSMEGLQTAYTAAIAQCKGNVVATKAVIKAKDEMKSILGVKK